MPKWKPPPGYTYEDARYAVKKEFGAYADVNFDRKAPRADRFQVVWSVQLPNGKWQKGLLGSGYDWSVAVLDARARWAEWKRVQADALAAKKEDKPDEAPQP